MDLKTVFQYFMGEHAINFARGEVINSPSLFSDLKQEITGRIPYDVAPEYAKKDDCGSAFWYLVKLDIGQRWWVPSKRLATTEQGRLLMDAFDEKYPLKVRKTVVLYFGEETATDDSQKTISYPEEEISSQPETQPFPDEEPLSPAFIDWGDVRFSQGEPQEIWENAQCSEPDSGDVEWLRRREEEEQNTQIVQAQPTEDSSSEDFFGGEIVGSKRGRITAVEILEQEWFKEREEKRRKLQIRGPQSIVLVPASPEREQKSHDSSEDDDIVPATQDENGMRPGETLLAWWKRMGDRNDYAMRPGETLLAWWKRIGDRDNN